MSDEPYEGPGHFIATAIRAVAEDYPDDPSAFSSRQEYCPYCYAWKHANELRDDHGNPLGECRSCFTADRAKRASKEARDVLADLCGHYRAQSRLAAERKAQGHDVSVLHRTMREIEAQMADLIAKLGRVA